MINIINLASFQELSLCKSLHCILCSSNPLSMSYRNNERTDGEGRWRWWWGCGWGVGTHKPERFCVTRRTSSDSRSRPHLWGVSRSWWQELQMWQTAPPHESAPCACLRLGADCLWHRSHTDDEGHRKQRCSDRLVEEKKSLRETTRTLTKNNEVNAH